MPELDGRQIFGLVSLLALLVLWVSAWRDQQGWRRHLKRRREAARDDPRPPETDHGGPWG